jgi:hypothetical protein
VNGSHAVALALALAALAAFGCERKATPTHAIEEPVLSAHAAGAASAVTPREVHTDKVEFPEVPIRAGATTTVRVAWKTPVGTGVNEDAPFKVRWNRSDALAEAPADVKSTGTSAREGFDIVVKPLAGAPNATLGGVIELVVCDTQNHSACLPVRRTVEIEFVVAKAAAAETTVTLPLPQARGS